ncbi:MAG TPA: hypothetical protein ENG10_02915, partial [Candidatus Bathyarchaeota archaeon]|nr:hypothetical protein [Candidatus Bathyarchaeota archaeon]HEX69227.1 hypothetical protein [Candidatus Bathyarchaeota archaeon]
MLVEKQVTTKILIDILQDKRVPHTNIDILIDGASKNKVLLHLLRVLNIQGSLREWQESSIRRVIKVVRAISKLLKGYDCAFFKLIKPVCYVPADVDLLVGIDHVNKIVKDIMTLGYRITVKDPFCVTLTRDDSIIDLYIHPSLGGVIFLNGQKLLEHTCTKEFNGVEVRSLESYAEALVAASHAIYKERIYTLNDFFTVEKWISKKTIRLAQELSCEDALKVAMNLNRKIRLGLLETPYKIPLPL